MSGSSLLVTLNALRARMERRVIEVMNAPRWHPP
jgi:hypothetical protein